MQDKVEDGQEQKNEEKQDEKQEKIILSIEEEVGGKAATGERHYL